MKKFLILTGGWFLTIVGAILSPVPMPLPFPFPIGITMLLVGCAILTTHSKAFRRGVQYLRHHNARFSRALEWVSKHTTDIVEKMAHSFTQRRKGRVSHSIANMARRAAVVVRTMVHRTAPRAHGRQARMRARRGSD